MALVTPDQVAQVTGFNRIGLGFLSKPLMWIIGLNAINKVYDKYAHLDSLSFIDGVFKETNLKYTYFQDELQERIPKEGPFVVVSNHPLGTIDGMILIKLISEVRPDFKVMANFLLQYIKPLASSFLAVNPFTNHKERKSSMKGMKESLLWIKDGHGMGIFPSGEVATYQRSVGKITEIPWEDTAIRLIQKMDVPVVPVYFKARLRKRFYIFAAMHGIFRTLMMPGETLNKKRSPISVRIGRPIYPDEYQQKKEVPDLKAFLRVRVYRLANPLEEKLITRLRKQIDLRLSQHKTPKAILDETPKYLVWEEIENLRSGGKKLTEFRTYEVFFAYVEQMPNIMREISRLREITFREVGEGTNEACDIDAYDSHYGHLFLWDNQSQQIAGAYRLGMGADIFAKHGIEGFYVHSLFRIDTQIFPLFKGSLEMGRAFIIKEYQTKPMPLFLLWKGITHVILRNPNKVRYLTGCVSISNQFSKYSKDIMIAYVKRYFFDADMAQYIQPRKEYKVRLDIDSLNIIESAGPDDINKFDRFIDEIEPGKMRFPVLLKKYIKQNAKIVSFNIDPLFNNSIDGFMYIDINDLPEQTIKPVAEELEAAARELTARERSNQ